MIDTIEFTYPSPWVEPNDLTDPVIHSIPNTSLKSYTVYISADNGAPLTFTYIPYADHGKHITKLRFSLPHVVFGNNYQMLYDIQGGIAKASTMMPNIPLFPEIDLYSGKLTRLDPCYNRQVGDSTMHYIRQLQCLSYPNRVTLPYSDYGVRFKPRSKKKVSSTTFYDKAAQLRETGYEKDSVNAQGILRQEALCWGKSIQSLTHKKYPTAEDISVDLCAYILERDLRRLKILGCDFQSIDRSIPQLTKKYGWKDGFWLVGMLAAQGSSVLDEALAEIPKMHSRSVLRKRLKLYEEHIACAPTPAILELEPLIIDREMIKEQVERQKIV